jgi:adenine/guanine/hypoxanthine permease
MSFLQKRFSFAKHNTCLSTEILSGITSFLTMSYIIFVNPAILQDAHLDQKSVLIATVLVSSLASIAMGLFANLPYSLGPGLGISTFFAYTLVLSRGISPQTALGLTALSGVALVVISFTKYREAIISGIPANIRKGLSAGIGLFVILIGLKNAQVITSSPSTLVTSSALSVSNGLFLVGFLLITVLFLKGVKAAFFITIALLTMIGYFIGDVSLPSNFVSTPHFPQFTLHNDLLNTLNVALLPALCVLFLTQLFDISGCVLTLSEISGLKTKNDTPVNFSKALNITGLSSIAFAAMGSSGSAVFLENAAGLKTGGKTGLTAIVTGLCFLPFLFFSDLATMIPAYATAPSLVFVGLLMLQPLQGLDFNNLDELIPALLALILIPLMFSITEGMLWAIVCHTTLKICLGKFKDISKTMIVLTLLAIVAFIF